MAATNFLGLVFFILFLTLVSPLQREIWPEALLRNCWFDHLRNVGFKSTFEHIYLNKLPANMLQSSRHLKIRRPVVSWGKRGHQLLAQREYTSFVEITISMGIEKNPGPTAGILGRSDEGRSSSKHSLSYNRNELIALRKPKVKPSDSVIEMLKSLELFRFRGCRAGGYYRFTGKQNKIPTIITRRPAKKHSQYSHALIRNLVNINCSENLIQGDVQAYKSYIW